MGTNYKCSYKLQVNGNFFCAFIIDSDLTLDHWREKLKCVEGFWSR